MTKLLKTGALIACVLLLSGFTSERVTFPSVAVFNGIKPVQITAQLARPADAAGKRPAIILWHTCGGVSDHVARFWPEYFTGLGYVTLTIDSFTPRSNKTCMTPASLMLPAGRQSTSGDPYGALRFLAGLAYVDAGRIALMGFSYGGIMTAYISNTTFATPEGLRFRALVSFYGHCSKTTADAASYPGGDPKYPWLIVQGELESAGFHTSCKALAGKPGVELQILPGAHHAWDAEQFKSPRSDEAGNVMLYNKDATERSKIIVRDFLAAQFK